MAVSHAEGKIEVERLVEQFARNVETYKRPGYKEARVRIEFVEPFVAALPQALLAHPGGGTLACVGHVERAWTDSIRTPTAGPQLLPFQNAISITHKTRP
jgi:hypothetical protein